MSWRRVAGTTAGSRGSGPGAVRPVPTGFPSRPSGTGSSTEALSAARRSLLRRGVALVLGAFLLHGLAFCCVPEMLSRSVSGSLQVGELAAAAQVLVIGFGVWTHDRGARRRVDPLARRVTARDRDGFGRQPALTGADTGAVTRAVTGAVTGTGPASGAATRTPGPSAPFDAFDSVRAFGGRAPL
ncbi:hypothetical protein ACFPA8_14855 [Streptomyces ovatisporus]|uniref:Integral membrane protein n=1 Tax=Streptomyces ovatisporus TaxID=1128682 RepID=A0ABV9A688_9ACTN